MSFTLGYVKFSGSQAASTKTGQGVACAVAAWMGADSQSNNKTKRIRGLSSLLNGEQENGPRPNMECGASLKDSPWALKPGPGARQAGRRRAP